MEKSKPAKRRGEWSARLWFSSRIKEDLTGNGDISAMYISVLGWWKNECEYPRLEHTWYVGKKNKDGAAAETERLSKREAGDKVGEARSSRVLQAKGRILDSITLLFFKIPFFFKLEYNWFLPGESHGQRNLAGYSPWGHKSWTRLSD